MNPVGESIEALIARARRYEEREEFINQDDGNAVKAWRDVLARDPGNREAQESLEQIRTATRRQLAAALQSGQLATARAVLEQAVAAFPEDPEFRAKLEELSAADR
ncbi:MAG: hypothetical protein MUE46_11465 [Xanthomonadales bacterium]|nr:hypothetical protein [Xanthomonadales bacterium]